MRDLQADGPDIQTFRYRSESGDGPGRGLKIEKGGQARLNIETEGPCAIYLGLVTPSPNVTASRAGRTEVIKANDSYFHGVKETFPPFSTIRGGKLFARRPVGDERDVSQEFFAGHFAADDKGPLVITADDAVRITHVRIRPLDPGEAALLSHQNDPTANRRVIYNNDGFSGFGEKDWQPSDLYKQIDRFRDSDALRLDVQTVSAGRVQYPSAYAEFFGENTAGFQRQFEVNAAANYRKLEAAGMSLYPALVKRGAEIGLPVWGSIRVSATYGTGAWGATFNGRLWREHPEFRIRQKNGQPIEGRAQMSFACEKVREEQLGQLVDLARLGCAGVTVDFLMPPVLGYDEPLLEEFQRRHGEDPRRLPDNDPRWIDLRCEVITGFLRDLRNRLNALGQKESRPIGVTVRVPAVGCRMLGFDPEVWIREKLVDELVPGFPDSEKWYDAEPWVKMASGSGVKIFGNIEFFIHETSRAELTDAEVAAGMKEGIQTVYTRDHYLRRAAELYRAGVDGLYLYNNFMHDAPRNPSLNFLGDKTWVKRWSDFEDPWRLPSEIIAIEN